MPIVNLAEWSAFYTTQPDAHILQSGRWGKLKEQFGWEVIRFVHGKAGAQVLIRKLPVGQSMAYIPMGPIGKNWPVLLEEIDDFCLHRPVCFLKIEPDEGLDPLELTKRLPGIAPSPHTIQPRRTVEVDLTGENDKLLSRMKQKTRYNINLATKKGVSVRPWDDLTGFQKMMETTGERDAFGVHSLSYYQQAYELFHADASCELLAAFHEDEVLAALMVFSAGKRAWYLYGASSNQNRHLMPTYLLQWEAMQWAKVKGCTRYDLWGVPDNDEEYLEEHFNNRHDGLWGVYRFKRGFGGSVTRSVGAFDRVYRKPFYYLYRLYIKLIRHIE